MYSPITSAIKYLHYYLLASNGKGHGIHSPFVFNFVKEVLNDKRPFYAFQQIEHIRTALINNPTVLTIEDFGAGSKTGLTKQRAVSSIAKSSLKPKKYAQLLFKMVNYYQPQTILELGTSLGITSSYLAAANNKAKLITMEGSTAVANIAKENFAKLALQNIELVEGNFDYTLNSTLNKIQQIDFAFLDGNHRYEPTLNYFNSILPKLHNTSIVVLDDIHWSKEMEQAWQYVQEHKATTLTIDLYFIGIVLVSTDFKTKQHFTIRY